MKKEELIRSQATEYDSFYLYDEGEIITATQALKTNFKDVKFLYSIKTNANPHVVSSVLSQGFGVDAASVAEVKMGCACGIAQQEIQYSAPGKTLRSIEETIDSATIIADSLNELQLIQSVAQKRNMTAHIGVRVNPSFSFDGGESVASKFGIDEVQLFEALPDILALKNVCIVGLHIHLKSQELDGTLLQSYYKNVLDLAEKFQSALGHRLEFINMGSGIGIPYSKSDIPVNLEQLGMSTSTIVKQFKESHPEIRIYIETGRYAVGKSGVYVTKVLDKKISCGKTFVILCNTLNGFIRPSMSELVMKYSDETNPMSAEPLFTGKDSFAFLPLNGETVTEVVSLVGNLCTANDIIASEIRLPKLEIGDLVVMTNAGSYAAVLSPMQFSSQIPPAELFLDCNGNLLR